MSSITAISTLFLLSILPFAFCSIPSSGTQTAGSVRNALPDSAFKIDPRDGAVTRTADWTSRAATVADFPALGGADVQTLVSRTSIRPGKAFITHSHPRSSETLYLVRGRLNATFSFEGASPRVVTNLLSAGQATVFPQGLVHSVRCVSKSFCEYVATFNSADPGLVPV